MARVTVTVDAIASEDGKAHVSLDELIQGVQLENEQLSVQFLERLAWAIECDEGLECP